MNLVVTYEYIVQNKYYIKKSMSLKFILTGTSKDYTRKTEKCVNSNYKDFKCDKFSR